MRRIAGLVWIGFTAATLARAALPAAAETVLAAPSLAPPAALTQPEYLYEIMRHLYRWYLDESDVEKLADKNCTFRAWRLDAKLDEGDRSELAEIDLPWLGIAVKVKQADYAIEDLGIQVKSRGFRIVNVARPAALAPPPPGAAVVTVPVAEMRDYLFRTRAQAEFPDAAMFERLRVALREHLGLDPARREAGEQIVHVAPLSPVANELWVFWENKKMLVRFASDIDLENPAMWKHQTLAIRTHDILAQTVVSLNEAPGSNAFLTRDQVGRALFNCIVLGQRLAVINPAPAGEPPGAADNGEAGSPGRAGQP